MRSMSKKQLMPAFTIICAMPSTAAITDFGCAALHRIAYILSPTQRQMYLRLLVCGILYADGLVIEVNDQAITNFGCWWQMWELDG